MNTTHTGAPEGAITLFFIQVFATLGFAVLYSTLVLYATKGLAFSAKDAAAMMGMFGAFNYGLHLVGGWMGGRLLSNRNLFIGGMVLQALGCLTLAAGGAPALYAGLALFLTGSGLNVTCINMMLTQRFTPEDNRREAAFLWNYAGMNIGFFVGFTVAGHYQLTQNYHDLFIFATVGNVASIAIALAFYKKLADLATPLLQQPPARWRQRLAVGVLMVLAIVPLVWAMLQQPDSANLLLKLGCAAVGLWLLVLTLRHPDAAERRRMIAYLLLALGSLVFWSLYQMAPNGLQLFTDNNVDRIVWGQEIAPQWIQNINTIVIVLGGPLLAAWFARLRTRGWPIDIPQQFAAALLLIGIAFLLLPLGIARADAAGKVAFGWLLANYILQSLGELMISPIGYAMIGRLAPAKHQGVMMGAWMMLTGLASLVAGDFSGLLPEPSGATPTQTNPAYAELFGQLGWGAVITGVVMAALVPLLRRLIGGKG